MKIIGHIDNEVVDKEAVGKAQYVSVVGFDMPFFHMVAFMIKWAIASIPAAFILFVAGAIISGLLGK